MEHSLQVVYSDPGGSGYHCVQYMARLAAELLGGELVVVDSANVSTTEKLRALLPRKRTGQSCLMICPSPVDLNALLVIENWRERYGRLVAWVFDSFWTSYIPRFARRSRIFDHIFITEREDIDVWRSLFPVPVEWLPWGSDVLRLGSGAAARPIDLLRFGRQPSEWDDDTVTSLGCEERNLNFHGRPQVLPDATLSERSLMDTLSKAKFTLSFSNRVSPNPQTHPHREYVTGRWTDALAAGATVAGIPPHTETVRSLLWPEALLDLGTVELNEGLQLIARAVDQWSPDHARLNYLRSLEHLDWRWRFRQLAAALDMGSDRLDMELDNIRDMLKTTA
jgi:hypothetical protein